MKRPPVQTSSISDGRQSLIEVLLVDDDTEVLEDVRDALVYQKAEPYTFEIVGVAHDGQQALNLARELEPDIIVMDLLMPGLDGVQVADVLNREAHPAKVLIFSSFLDFKDMASIVKAGVRGYIVKGNLKELVRGVTQVYQGQPWFPQEVVESLFRQQFSKQEDNSIRAKGSWQDLSPRERQIVTLHQEGASKQAIAEQLGVSLSTIKTYFTRIGHKYDLNSPS